MGFGLWATSDLRFRLTPQRGQEHRFGMSCIVSSVGKDVVLARSSGDSLERVQTMRGLLCAPFAVAVCRPRSPKTLLASLLFSSLFTPPFEMSTDYYALLRLDPQCSQEEVRAAYLSAVSLLSPRSLTWRDKRTDSTRRMKTGQEVSSGQSLRKGQGSGHSQVSEDCRR